MVLSLATAQDRKQITFSQLSVNDGLSQNSVVSVAQDTIGYLWFATQDGLNRYNGLEFDHYPILFDDVTKEDYSRLGKVFISSDNEIFVISKGGQLQKQDLQTDSFVPVERITDASSMEESSDKSLWIGTYNNGLYKIDSKTSDTLVSLQNERLPTAIYDLYSFRKKMVVAASNSLFVVDIDNSRNVDEIEQSGTNFSAFAEVNDTLWVGSFGKGLFFTDTLNSLTQFTGFNNSESIPDDLNILALNRDNKNRLWIGTYGDGAYLIDFNTRQIQHFTAAPRNPKAIHYNDTFEYL